MTNDAPIETHLGPMVGHRAKVILNQTDEQTSDAAERRRVLEWALIVFVHKTQNSPSGNPNSNANSADSRAW
jgi:hypothetical protein